MNLIFLKPFYIQSKEIGSKKYYKETRELENGKLRFRLNFEARKEKKDSWLNAIKTKNALVIFEARVQQQPIFTLWSSFLDS